MKSSVKVILRLGAGGALLTVPIMASALKFEYGDIQGSFDTTVSLGATMRMEDRDDALVGISNGGSARSVNDDDGNLAFEKGDVVSAVAKATHDLELKWHDYGIFARVNYFYDQVAADAEDREDRFAANGAAVADRKANEYELGERGRDRLESELDLLDLFVYGNFDVAGRKLSARFGRQVVSWGESTFIGNGINSINPIDVAKIRTPGAELKEALLPLPMLWSSFQITDSLGIEGVWMTSWDKTEIDPRGSFFSTSDIVSDDGDRAVTGFGRREDDNHITRPPTDGSAHVVVPRERTRNADDAEKQFGIALRYYAEAAAGTEFGLYYLNYHSRTPLISAVRGGATHLANVSTTDTCSTSAVAGCRATYFTEYPENIELFGLSFNTDGPFGVAIQGEYSYRPEQPVQLGGTEILLTALGVPNSINPFPAAALPLGTEIRGYREVEMHQVQTTFTKAFGPTWAAEQFTLLAEVGYNHLALPDNLRFNGPGAGLPACGFLNPPIPAPTAYVVSNNSCQSEGYATDSSWGYRVVSRMDFENLIGAVGVSPRLVLGHDVNGVGPNFNQDTKAVTLGVAFNYLQRWQADIGYTTFFGGRTYSGTDASGTQPFGPGGAQVPVSPGSSLGPGNTIPGSAAQPLDYATSANPNKDRDFLALSVSYAF
ncbi:DUF1302 domain-containing protein [Solimonas sp. K1W22B-7]|uniref:DUF1302 domain-containing protein n=1 Tax=Solimonas sp. K1W22B-7 TaxID=2303331 RepID=UPI000E335B07|nr:DUF1302 domain-containing protein [Solimonas sp. K1W22B-7]AXQ27896.1 DUF1302 domain-containing protein [Solimonas sp. K1W22B-7]